MSDRGKSSDWWVGIVLIIWIVLAGAAAMVGAMLGVRWEDEPGPKMCGEYVCPPPGYVGTTTTSAPRPLTTA